MNVDQPARVPISRMRGAIARQMIGSLTETAQLTLVRQASVAALAAERRSAPEDARPSWIAAFVKATALALGEHPRLNSRLEGDCIEAFDQINIGVAVAIDDGLLVPVVENADRQSLLELTATIRDLARESRDQQRVRGRVRRTFTVTSLGEYGIDAFTPIINPPEAGILGVGRIIERPVRGKDGLGWEEFVTLSLTFDHRLLDGAPAARFLSTVTSLLANPTRLKMRAQT